MRCRPTFQAGSAYPKFARKRSSDRRAVKAARDPEPTFRPPFRTKALDAVRQRCRASLAAQKRSDFNHFSLRHQQFGPSLGPCLQSSTQVIDRHQLISTPASRMEGTEHGNEHGFKSAPHLAGSSEGASLCTMRPSDGANTHSMYRHPSIGRRADRGTYSSRLDSARDHGRFEFRRRKQGFGR